MEMYFCHGSCVTEHSVLESVGCKMKLCQNDGLGLLYVTRQVYTGSSLLMTLMEVIQYGHKL